MSEFPPRTSVRMAVLSSSPAPPPPPWAPVSTPEPLPFLCRRSDRRPSAHRQGRRIEQGKIIAAIVVVAASLLAGSTCHAQRRRRQHKSSDTTEETVETTESTEAADTTTAATKPPPPRRHARQQLPHHDCGAHHHDGVFIVPAGAIDLGHQVLRAGSRRLAADQRSGRGGRDLRRHDLGVVQSLAREFGRGHHQADPGVHDTFDTDFGAVGFGPPRFVSQLNGTLPIN